MMENLKSALLEKGYSNALAETFVKMAQDILNRCAEFASLSGIDVTPKFDL